MENRLPGGTVITWVIILLNQRAQIQAFFYPCSWPVMANRHQQQQLLPIVIIIIEHVFIYLIIYNMFVPTFDILYQCIEYVAGYKDVCSGTTHAPLPVL